VKSFKELEAIHPFKQASGTLPAVHSPLPSLRHSYPDNQWTYPWDVSFDFLEDEDACRRAVKTTTNCKMWGKNKIGFVDHLT
jgi:cytolysin (calcineurin-like family phosphatase)